MTRHRLLSTLYTLTRWLVLTFLIGGVVWAWATLKGGLLEVTVLSLISAGLVVAMTKGKR